MMVPKGGEIGGRLVSVSTLLFITTGTVINELLLMQIVYKAKPLHNWEPPVVSGNLAHSWRLRAVI